MVTEKYEAWYLLKTAEYYYFFNAELINSVTVLTLIHCISQFLYL